MGLVSGELHQGISPTHTLHAGRPQSAGCAVTVSGYGMIVSLDLFLKWFPEGVVRTLVAMAGGCKVNLKLVEEELYPVWFPRISKDCCWYLAGNRPWMCHALPFAVIYDTSTRPPWKQGRIQHVWAVKMCTSYWWWYSSDPFMTGHSVSFPTHIADIGEV